MHECVCVCECVCVLLMVKADGILWLPGHCFGFESHLLHTPPEQSERRPPLYSVPHTVHLLIHKRTATVYVSIRNPIYSSLWFYLFRIETFSSIIFSDYLSTV